MFLQIHTLTSYPASLLNRDDAGLAKRVPFGNATRLRISSQCLKRHWRTALVEMDSIGDFVARVDGALLDDGYRSRKVFQLVQDRIKQKLRGTGESETASSEAASVLVRAVQNLTITKSKSKLEQGDTEEGKDEGKGALKQAIYLSKPEVSYLVHLALKMREIEPDMKKVLSLSEPKRTNDKLKKDKDAFRDELTSDENLSAMLKSARGFTSALFGRMVTSDLFARVDAPVHVAHSMTVHVAQAEMDYFTVVDDLAEEEETGGAHLGQTELGAGVYYGYVAVDVPLLVSNLSGHKRKAWKEQDADTTRHVLGALVRTIASQSPGAKLGSTAPYAYADLVLLEVGEQQPRTLANAFLEAVPTRAGHLAQVAAERMAGYLNRVDGMYGQVGKVRTLSSSLEVGAYAPLAAMPIDQTIGKALDAIWS